MQVTARHYLKVRFGFACILFFLFTLAARADIFSCDTCGKPILDNFFWITDKVSGKRLHICQACENIQGRCYICDLPAVAGSEKLSDGRFICPREIKTIVESETEAKQICGTVNYDLNRLLSRFMNFPDDNVQISIVDKYHLDELFQAPGNESSCVWVYGATSTHPLPGNKYVHTVDLLSHMQNSRLKAVSAHEFTHTWMNENVARDRQLTMDKDSLEGFCELVAYKYMTSLNEQDEMASIKRNFYTHGQILVLIAAEEKFGFNTVMEWIQNGEDTRLDMDKLDRVRVLKDHIPVRTSAAASSAPELVYGTKPIAAPTTLTLKSISGSPSRRFALINSTTFETNEKNRVKVGTNNFSVRCLEIHNDSVVIQVDDSPEKKQLFLSVH
jgi:hypothetical protein